MIARHGAFEYGLADKYRFEEELGRGAMGIVYRAQDVRLGRPVAIKMLHPMLTNELGVARFQSEIRIAAGLHHPNIIAVHESGEVDGRLFYVMDYLGGETLRARLQREKQLPVDDALRIVEDVAAGLQYAHDHGVVHRDVKPENILLADGRACIVDFGLARALSDVDTQRLTASGLSVGTPHYLSPEQASAEKEVGPKADQYALACVLYEMLVGEPPFTGPTASAIAMRHITENPPAMRLRRKTTSVSIEAAVMRAMEKVPADRWGSVREFNAACNGPVVTPGSVALIDPVKHPRSSRSKSVLAGVTLTVAIVLAVLGLARSDNSAGYAVDDAIRWLTNRTLDSMKVVVVPSSAQRSSSAALIDGEVHQALSRWQGISVPAEEEVTDLVAPNTSRISLARARAIARSLGAGRFIMAESAPLNEALKVRLRLFSTRDLTHIRETTLSQSALGSADSASHACYMLLFDGDLASRHEAEVLETRSIAAATHYLLGLRAERMFNLPSADSSFTAALRYDANFPSALLALSQVRSWARDDAPDAFALASRASDGAPRAALTTRLHASALRKLLSGQFPSACVDYGTLVEQDSLDFAAWFGLSECNRRDKTVVMNLRTPTGPAFRGSPHRAATAIARAFDLIDGLDPCCVQRANVLLRRPLYLSPSSVLFGRGERPDSEWYGAYPELHGDTIAFVPLPIRDLSKAPPPSHTLAIDMERRRFLALAAKRAAQSPKSADALEQLTEALEFRGSVATLDTLRRARALASSPSQALRLAVMEVWIRVKGAIPTNVAELRRARSLADSLLAHARVESSTDAELLASLAALVGDAIRAAHLSEKMDAVDVDASVPPEVRGSAWALLAYAALGEPADSLQRLEARVTNEIASGVVPQQQSMARSMALGRPAILAFPSYRASVFGQLDTLDGKIAAEVAYMHGDTATVRKRLAQLLADRSGVRPADLTLDALYPQSWLFAAIGDTANALSTIGRSLDAISLIPSKQLASAVIGGSIVQSMVLRANLLLRSGDRMTGQIWERAAITLTDSDFVRRRSVRGAANRLAR